MDNLSTLELGIDIYHQLQSEIQPRRSSLPALSHPDRSTSPEAFLNFFNHVQSIPPRTVILGECRDQIPLFLDLQDSDLGSLLITADPDSGQSHQLELILASALFFNRKSEIRPVIISSQQNWYRTDPRFNRSQNPVKVIPWYDTDLGGEIQKLANLCDDRNSGRHAGQTYLVLFDDFDQVNTLDYQTQMEIRWLVKYGPQAGIWPIVSGSPDFLCQVPFWTDLFRTRLLGRIDSPILADQLSIFPDSPVRRLGRGMEFATRFNQQWFIYRLPTKQN
jgi:hypothetical protein